MNVAEYILNIIQRLGTDTAFSLTGGMAMHINRAAAESNLRIIYCNHEQAVAAAADGYAKAKEFCIPGLAIVTSGPGVTNTITSVASAFFDSVPMYILAGQVKTNDFNTHGVRSYGAQETPHLVLMKPITKCAFTFIPSLINDEKLAKNLSEALSGRKGPVFIDIPIDIQPQEIDDAESRIEKIISMINQIIDQKTQPISKAANHIVDELKRAKKPIIVIGNGLRISGVSRKVIKELIRQLNIPALFTWASFDLLEYNHDLNFGCAGGLAPTHSNKILQESDLAIFFGVRLDLLTTAFNPNNYGKNAYRIVVDIDEKEIKKNANLSHTIFFNEDITNVVEKLSQSIITTLVSREWINHCQTLRSDDYKNELKIMKHDRLTSYQVTRVLSQSKNINYIVPTASGYAIEGIARFLKPLEGSTFAWGGHVLGSMGLGLPSAIGAAAALKESVICLEGDGGLLLNVQELFTLAANPDLPLTIIILNNDGYQSIMKSQNRAFGKEFGASKTSGLFKLDFSLLAKLAHFEYIKCDSLIEFEGLVANISHRCFIDLILEEDGYRGPAVQTKFDKDGKPYSTDINDISWE